MSSSGPGPRSGPRSVPEGPKSKVQRPGPGLYINLGLSPPTELFRLTFRMTFMITFRDWEVDLEGEMEGDLEVGLERDSKRGLQRRLQAGLGRGLADNLRSVKVQVQVRSGPGLAPYRAKIKFC